MYPTLHLFGATMAIWNVAFVVGILLGCVVLRSTLASLDPGDRPALWPLRFIVTVYLSALGAQTFAYAVDLNTTLAPPPGVAWARYYFDPLFGPKTLYGAVLILPLGVLVACQPHSWRQFRILLDAWTPALLSTLAGSRVGCFLQGCCYGAPHPLFGVVFPPGSPAYSHQVELGWIHRGEPALPVIPAQGIEAIALFALAAWAFRAVAQRRPHVFTHGVVAYSLVRFTLEIWRDDPDRNGLGMLSTSQWIAIAILAMYGGWRATRHLRGGEFSSSRL